MKRKKLFIVALLLAAILIFIACGTAAAQNGPTQIDGITAPTMQVPAVDESTLAAEAQQDIGLERAKEIALAHAGCSASQVTFVKARKEYDDGIAEYDIEFTCDGWKYEYEIHANTGDVLESESKRVSTASQPVQSANTSQNVSGGITLERAKQIALADAGFTASQVRFTEAKKETDHGVAKYEIEFVKDGWEYEYEIHAGTGAILEKDKEWAD